RDVILRQAKKISAPVIEVASTYRLDEVRTTTDGCGIATAHETATDWTCRLAPRLPGRFQLQNAVTAGAGARARATRGDRIGNDAIENGIAKARWPGRLEKLQGQPDVYLDGAHNPSAAQELAAFWRENFAQRKIWLVYGALRDKAVDEIAGVLFPHVA